MKKILYTLLATIGISVVVFAHPFTVVACSGVDCVTEGAGTAQTGSGSSAKLETSFSAITKMIMYILGGISVIMMVVGGVKYTTSNGDAKNVESAKQTILYAIIGIVVALLGYAIVEFVIKALTT